jgi:hypothetical protein
VLVDVVLVDVVVGHDEHASFGSVIP